jgi:predicted nucleotidyltransferase
MQRSLLNILPDLRNLFPFIKENYNVKSIEVFGSFVRNENNSLSDLDLLVEFSDIPGLLKFVELENYLSDNLNIKVDLVMKDSLKPLISRSIQGETVPV